MKEELVTEALEGGFEAEAGGLDKLVVRMA
jgi:hypothetical protein